MDEERHYRSVSKSVLWRLMGIVILAMVTYAYTRSWTQTTLVTFMHHSVFLVVFYLHERIWFKIEWPKTLKWRSIAKMFTYETLCGNIILGIITFAVIGSWKQMTMITLTYIGIKHIVYIFNEFIWDRTEWGKTSQSKEILETPFLKVFKDKIQLSKKQINYWRIERPSISVILSFFDDKIVMINQYRYAIKQTSLELPAGLIKSNETPEECAKRELKEETGFTAKNIKKVLSYYSSNSISDQQVHICIADGLTKGKPEREEDEIIDVVLLSKQDVIDKILDETITDGRTINAILYVTTNRLWS